MAYLNLVVVCFFGDFTTVLEQASDAPSAVLNLNTMTQSLLGQ